MKRGGLVLFFLLIFISSIFALKEWTVLVYLNCDNNLEPYGIQDFMEMAAVGSDANINIVVQMDRALGYSTTYGDWRSCRRFYITAGMTPSSPYLSDLGEVDMGSPNTLSDFLMWGYDNYPANNFLVVLWDHGDGWTKGSPDLMGGLFKDFSNDDSSGKSISVAGGELDSALSTVFSHTGRKIELIGFDACLMQMFEVNEVCAPYASWYVASEETEGADGWIYSSWLDPLAKANGGMTPAQLGDKIAETYVNQGQSTQSVVDLSRIATAKTLLNTFAVKMREAIWLGYSSTINTLINNTTHMLQPYDPYGYFPPSHDYRDLGDFCDLVASSSLPATAKTAAADLKNEFANLVYSNHTYGTGYSDCDGVAIYLPTPANYETAYLGLPITSSNWDEFIRGIGLDPGTPSLNVSYYSNRIDDSTGGNGDSDLDGGETVDLYITIKNNGATAVTNISGLLSTSNSFTSVDTSSANFPDLGTKPNNNTGESLTPYVIAVDRSCPAGEVINFELDITADSGEASLNFSITVDQMAPKLVELIYEGHLLDDSLGGNGDFNADAAESILIDLTLKNIEIDGASGVSAAISTSNSYVTVNSDSSTYADIPSGNSITSDLSYEIFISTDCPAGENILFDINITANEGNWNDTFSILVDRTYEPTLYVGTSVILFPAWSNSGAVRRIAFIEKGATGTLIKTANADGTGIPLTVASANCDVSHVSQLSWSPDDQWILFAGSNPLRILGIKSDGSTPDSPALFQPSSVAAYYKWVDPHWTDALNMSDAKERITVSISGDIWAYISDSTVFDSELRRITELSDPAQDLTAVDKYYQARWSPDNMKIVFVRRPAARTNKPVDTLIYFISGIPDIIEGTSNSVSSLADPRVTLVNIGDAPCFSPSFSIDSSVVAYVKDVAGTFNNFTFYSSPATEIGGANFDVYGNGAVLGNPSMDNAFNEGFVSWAPTGGDRFTYVKEDTGNYELKVICDPSIGGFVKLDDASDVYVISDRSGTSLEISELDSSSVFSGVISSPISRPAAGDSFIEDLGIWRNISINGQNDREFQDHATLAIFVSQREIPNIERPSSLGIYKLDHSGLEELECVIIDDTDGNPENDLLDGYILQAQIDSSGTYGVLSDRSIDDCPVEEYGVLYGPNPASELINIIAEDAEEIEIFSISGEKVASLSHGDIERVHGNRYVWRLTNSENNSITAGIYIINVSFDAGKNALRKVAVIR
ncbi:hypothetical protein KAI78_01670 [bacterium]|nr:hypothetical protein [bacterium]